MSSCVINHHNCDYDTNCGLTCEGVYQREVLSDPGFVPPPGHYEDFIAMCVQYYFPGGCSGSVGDSLLPPGSSSFELTPAVIDSINAAFAIGFLGGVLNALPAVSCMVVVLLVVYLFAYATKPKGGS